MPSALHSQWAAPIAHFVPAALGLQLVVGQAPPNPAVYLTQCLILLLNSISHTLAQLAGAVYITQSFILLLYPMYYTLAQLTCVHY